MTRGQKLPHRYIERELMEKGEKRLAYFFLIEQAREFGDEFVREVHFYRGTPRVLVYRREDAALARSFRRTYDMHGRGLISADTAHARCGLLLGYEKQDIQRFIARREALP